MRILIYIPDISQGWGGVKQYSINLLNLLSKDENNLYFIYHNASDKDILSTFSGNARFKLIEDNELKLPKAIVYKNKLKRILNTLLYEAKSKIVYQTLDKLQRFCTKNRIDIVHCPYQYIPDIYGCKLITTMHDVQEIHFPEYFSAEDRAYRAEFYLKFLRLSDKIIVSYNHVKNDLIKYFEVEENKISVVDLDLSTHWIVSFLDSEPIELKHFHIPEKFFLYPANTWEHKNHIGLINAIAAIRDKYGVEVNFVFTGDQNEYFPVILKRAKELSLEQHLFFIGVVNEEELFSLYKSCHAVVVPTLYEAGSFPLMESILLGIPVICSDVTSLGETIGDQSFCFNPYNIDDMSEKISQLWLDNNFRTKSIENAKTASIKLNERNGLSKYLNIYNAMFSD